MGGVMKKMAKKSGGAKRAASQSRAIQDAVEFVASARETSAPANKFCSLLTDDAIESLVRTDLYSVCENLRDDLRRRVGGHGIAIFDKDLDEDVRLIAAHVLAFDIVLKYYGHSS